MHSCYVPLSSRNDLQVGKHAFQRPAWILGIVLTAKNRMTISRSLSLSLSLPGTLLVLTLSVLFLVGCTCFEGSYLLIFVIMLRTNMADKLVKLYARTNCVEPH